MTDTAADLAALANELRGVVAHINEQDNPDIGWIVETIDQVVVDLSDIAVVVEEPE